MLRLTKNVALPTLRCFSSRVTIDNINQKIRTADYAVRGEVVIRAMEIDKEMKQGKKFPFDSLLYCNVGNPQAIKQKPITFLREVLCITSWPEVAEKHPEMFHPDAIQRAKELLAANPGLKILDGEWVSEDYAIGLKKGNTQLLEAINKAMAELKADGTFQAIVDKYITAD